MIAVITVSIILNIIDNAEKGSAQDSALGYKDALQKYYATKSIQNPEQELPSGYMEISELPSDFTVSGENPSDGWVKLKNGIVEEYSLKYKIDIYIKGRIINLVGYYDTGSLIKDPYQKRPIIIKLLILKIKILYVKLLMIIYIIL